MMLTATRDLTTSLWSEFPSNTNAKGESLHCALLSDYVPPEDPHGTPLGNALRIRRPKLDWRGINGLEGTLRGTFLVPVAVVKD